MITLTYGGKKRVGDLYDSVKYGILNLSYGLLEVILSLTTSYNTVLYIRGNVQLYMVALIINLCRISVIKTDKTNLNLYDLFMGLSRTIDLTLKMSLLHLRYLNVIFACARNKIDFILANMYRNMLYWHKYIKPYRYDRIYHLFFTK